MTADKSAAAWHPGDGPVRQTDLDALLLADAVLAEAFSRKSNLLESVGELIRQLVYDQRRATAALAAETARADQAERRIANAPHGSGCGHVDWDADGLLQLGKCDCWKSAAPTTEQ